MTIGIYGIFDNSNDECLYIGQTLDINLRWKQHLKLLKSKKHPRKDFAEWYHSGNNSDLIDFRVLEECKKDELNDFEIKWFNLLLPKYYGKKPSINESWRHSEETKNKIRDSINEYNLRNNIVSEKNCNVCNNVFYGSRKTKICFDCKNDKKTILKCVLCDKNIINVRRSKIYCSKDCKMKSFKKNNPNWESPKSSFKNFNKNDLKRLYMIENRTIKEICEFFNCKERTVYYQLKRFNIPKRYNK